MDHIDTSYVRDRVHKDFGYKHHYIMRVNIIQTGVMELPIGRVVELFGDKSIGKTTFIMNQLGKLQDLGMVVAYIDADHTFDPEYAEWLGVDIDKLIVHKPMTLEESFKTMKELVKSRVIDVIVLNSVYNLVSHFMTQHEALSKELKEFTPMLAHTKTTVIFVNQLFKDPITKVEYTSGGDALRYYASLRIKLHNVKPLKNAYGHYGNRVTMEVVKNLTQVNNVTKEFKILFKEKTGDVRI